MAKINLNSNNFQTYKTEHYNVNIYYGRDVDKFFMQVIDTSDDIGRGYLPMVKDVNFYGITITSNTNDAEYCTKENATSFFIDETNLEDIIQQ